MSLHSSKPISSRSDAWSFRNSGSSVGCNSCAAWSTANSSTSARARWSKRSAAGPPQRSIPRHPGWDWGNFHSDPWAAWSSSLNDIIVTWEFLSEVFPVLPEFFHHGSEFLVFGLCPALFGLVGESSESAVAHFGISARKMLRNLVKQNIWVRAELHKQSVLFFGPGSFGLFIPLLYQVLLADYYHVVILRIFVDGGHLLLRRKVLEMSWGIEQAALRGQAIVVE